MALPCANDGLWDYDAQTNSTWFSPRWKAMLGFAEGDIITSPDWHRMVHPEDLARVSAAMRDHIAGKLPMFESVHRLKHTDGEWRWVRSISLKSAARSRSRRVRLNCRTQNSTAHVASSGSAAIRVTSSASD